MLCSNSSVTQINQSINQNYTCAFPAVIRQNVCCKKDLCHIVIVFKISLHYDRDISSKNKWNLGICCPEKTAEKTKTTTCNLKSTLFKILGQFWMNSTAMALRFGFGFNCTNKALNLLALWFVPLTTFFSMATVVKEPVYCNILSHPHAKNNFLNILQKQSWNN